MKKKEAPTDLILDIANAATDLHKSEAQEDAGTRAVPARRTILGKRAQADAGKGVYFTLPVETHRRLRDLKFARQDAGENVSMSQIVDEILTAYMDSKK